MRGGEDPVTAESIADEFPGWEAWQGIDQLWHARVRGLRLRSWFTAKTSWICVTRSSAGNPALGVSFFVILLPWTTGLVSLHGRDADGQVLPS
jgi:hypothetical protein